MQRHPGRWLAVLSLAALAATTGACGSSKSNGNSSGGGGNGTAGGDGTAGNSGGLGGGSGTAGNSGGLGGKGMGGTGMGGHVGMGGMLGACQAPIPITGGTAVTVTANLGMVGKTVSTDMMGIHTSVYDNNMQLDTTVWMLQDAGVKSLRYPGGSYSDLYHWELNTGTQTPASGGGSNTVYIAPGTDFGSFIGFMDRVGASAMITVNYGMNSAGTGPGRPQEAAAWVAYANGSPTSTVAIGTDDDGVDWKTVGYWAGLRAAKPLAVDDGNNFLRINHPTPAGIKYWEIGNELYGNGFYYGGCGWESDLHVPYPDPPSTTCAGTPRRLSNASLGPAVYGAAVKAFSTAMKAVDPSIKIGGIVNWPQPQQYPSWNPSVLMGNCSSMDFAVVHWYAGKTLAGLPAVAGVDIPAMFSTTTAGANGPGLPSILATAAYGCPANMPIAVTEWGPNTNTGNVVIPASTADAAPAGSQLVGLFAAEAYANFMEQGALSVHWLELHNNTYLAGIDPTGDPFTTENDTQRWGYHGQQMAHFLAAGNDKMVTATVAPAGVQATIKAHASVHNDGSIAIMITNIDPATAANVTVNVTGGSMLSCSGVRFGYEPINGDQDGKVLGSNIFSTPDGSSVPVAVPANSSVVVWFPKK